MASALELTATTFPEYAWAWWRKARSGESGVLPVIIGLAVIVLFFELNSSLYLSANNVVDLLLGSVVYIMFAIGEVFVLLLGEIDLSVVYEGGIGACVIALLVQPPTNCSWWLAIPAGLGVSAAIGLVQGALITRLRLPAFIVTLAGYLGLFGVLTDMTGKAGTVSINPYQPLMDLFNATLSPRASKLALGVAVVVVAVFSIMRHVRHRRAGLVTPPISVTVLKVVMFAVSGGVVVWLCDFNRGIAGGVVEGLPGGVLAVVVVLVASTFVLSSTRFGRYVYAIGGNAEAARRAGINVRLVRTACFSIVGLMAGIAALMYMSDTGGIGSNIFASYMLYAVAAAVIGGTSLFGGRGKPVSAVLGGLVIAAVTNGVQLMGWSTATSNIVTAVVLLVAVTVDSMARRGTQRTA
jgi:D-xylose transport system permease protein